MNPHLQHLVRQGTIRSVQARHIHENWGDSPGDLFAQPQLRDIREHTRDYIDQLRGHFRAPVPFDEQDGGEIHG